MIELTRLNGAAVFINPDLIRLIDETPDTLITFVDGKTLMIKNRPPEVIEKIVDFKRRCTVPAARGT